jgi:hypothetical protein
MNSSTSYVHGKCDRPRTPLRNRYRAVSRRTVEPFVTRFKSVATAVEASLVLNGRENDGNAVA